MTDDWGEVVTRYPYENVRMDHLLSKEKGKKQMSSSYNKQARWPEHLKQTPTPILLCLVLKD